jgi:hypothetical protein
MKKRLFLLLLFLLLPVWCMGATYYVKKIDSTIYYKSDTWPTASDGSVIDLETLVESVTSDGDTVILSGGPVGGSGVSFIGTELDADGSLSIDKRLNFRGALSSDLGGVQNAGRVTLDANGQAVNCVKIELSGAAIGTVSLSNVRIGNTANSATNYALFADTNNWQFYDLELFGGYRHIYNTSASNTWHRIKSTGAGNTPVWNTNTCEYDLLIIENSASNGFYTSGGSPVLNNPIIIGTATTGIENNGTGTVTVNNGELFNIGIGDSTKYPIKNNSTGTIAVNNSIVLPNPGDMTKLDSGGTVTFSNSIYKSPLHRSGRRPHIVVLGLDDYTNLPLFRDTLVPKLESYGYRGTLALSCGTEPTMAEWADMANLVARGHEISAHGAAYSNMMTDRNGVQVQYTGAGTCSAAVTDDGGDYATLLTVTSSVGETENVSLTITASTTLANVLTAFSGKPYTITVSNTDTNKNGLPAKYFKTASYADIKTSATEIVFDHTRIAYGEMRDVKALIEANIPGYTCRTFIHPGNNADDTTRADALAMGFEGSRGSGLSSSTKMESIDIFNIEPVSLYVLFASAADPQTTDGLVEKYIATKVEYLKWVGGISAMYGHAVTEFTASAWDSVLAELSNERATVMTLGNAVAYLKSYDPSGDLATADGMTYTRTMVNAQDYRLRPGSPAINAGTDVGLTTDFLGKLVRGLPDIGAYEYYGVTGGMLMGLGVGF